VEPGHSIGPGVCETACPVETIQPVFGTEKCGIDLPCVTPTVATDVPAPSSPASLGGMGLLAREAIWGRGRSSPSGEKKSANELDVVIAGAEPAGSSTSLPVRE